MVNARQKRSGFTLIELLVVIAIIAILAAILFPVFAQARNQARKASCISNLKQLALAQLMYIQDYDEQFSYWDWGRDGINDSWNTPQGAGWWMNQTLPYIKSTGVYACSNDTRNDADTNGWGYAILTGSRPTKYYRSSYGINEHLVSIESTYRSTAAIGYPSSTVMYSDAIGPLLGNDAGDECDQWPPFGPTRTWFANAGAWGAWGSHRDYEAWKHTVRHGDGEVISYVDGHAGYKNNMSWMTEKVDHYCGDDVRPKRQSPVYFPDNVPH